MIRLSFKNDLYILDFLGDKITKNGYCFLLRLCYDITVYPPLETVPRHFTICYRNRWMVYGTYEMVSYVLHDWGGATSTLQYAKQKRKKIISLYYRVVVIKAPLQGLCYTVRDAVDW